MPLTQNVVRTYESADFNNLPQLTATTIFEGAAVGDNGSGFARPLVAGDPFRGFADVLSVNPGASGAKTVRLRRRGLISLAVTGVAGVADVGKAVFASDDGTFTLTPSTNSFIGKIDRLEGGTVCMVQFDANKAGIGPIGAITDDSGGTAAGTIAAIGDSYNQNEVRNAVASLAAKINQIAALLK